MNRPALTRLTITFTALAALLICQGCKSNSAPHYDNLMASDMGIGIHLLEADEDVRTFLGSPDSTREIQGGANIEEFYYGEGASQREGAVLSVNYVDGKLTRIHNRYDPLDEARIMPPFFIEPIPGVKLGNRLSVFIDAMGPQTGSVVSNTWVFTGADGSTITIMAEFTEVSDAGDSLCNRLQVIYGPKAIQNRGEDMGKKKL